MRGYTYKEFACVNHSIAMHTVNNNDTYMYCIAHSFNYICNSSLHCMHVSIPFRGVHVLCLQPIKYTPNKVLNAHFK